MWSACMIVSLTNKHVKAVNFQEIVTRKENHKISQIPTPRPEEKYETNCSTFQICETTEHRQAHANKQFSHWFILSQIILLKTLPLFSMIGRPRLKQLNTTCASEYTSLRTSLVFVRTYSIGEKEQQCECIHPSAQQQGVFLLKNKVD